MHKSGSGIRLTATLVSGFYGLAFFATGIDLPNLYSTILAYSPSAIGLGTVAFDLWMWKWPLVQRIFNRPDISGAWLGTIVQVDTGLNPGSVGSTPISCALLVEQTYWTLSLTQMTEESTSYTTSVTIVRRGESKHKLVAYTYHNEPQQRFRHKSQPSNGASHISVASSRPSELEGRYWTDRGTTGDSSYFLVGDRTDFSSLEQIRSYAKEESDK